jgi:hypothetical protein
MTAIRRLAASPAAPRWVLDAIGTLPDLRPGLVDPIQVQAAVAPYLWLLGRCGTEGLPLTAAGYLRPADVEALMVELGWSQWWIGAHNREQHTYPAAMLRESAMALRLVRRLRGRLVRSPAGRSVAGDPMALWGHIAASLPVERDDPDADTSAARLLWAATAPPDLVAEDEEAVRAAVGGLYVDIDGGPVLREHLRSLGEGSDEVLSVLGGVRHQLAPQLRKALAVTAIRSALGIEAPGQPTAASGQPAASGRPAGAAGEAAPQADATGPGPAGVAAPAPSSGSDPDDGVACVILKVTLRDVRPPVWRRVRVPVTIPLPDLAAVLIAAMGWSGYHLWAFRSGSTQYMIPDSDWPGRERDARKATVATVLGSVGRRLVLEYDFGDGWEHDVVVEGKGTGTPIPVVLAGRRRCPPEDVGGPWGYEEFLAAIADPAHPEHAMRLDWIGGPFDPAEFDLAEHDEAMRRAWLQGPGQ